MINQVRVLFRAPRLVNETEYLCKEITNFLIYRDYSIKKLDVAYIFQESYAICLFVLSRNYFNVDLLGRLVSTANQALKEWLNQVINDNCSKTKPTFEQMQIVEKSLKEMPKFYITWIVQFVEKHGSLKRKNVYECIPAAVAYYVDNINFYIFEKFKQTPNGFTNFIHDSALNSLNKLL